MKKDTKEVLSIPAGRTYNFIKRYMIHACPSSYTYKDSTYITFRQKGGIMETLYQVINTLILNPKEHYREKIKNLDPQTQERILKYIEGRKEDYTFSRDAEYRFYILSTTNNIELPHLPRITAQSHCYFTIDELTSGKQEVVVESKKRLS